MTLGLFLVAYLQVTAMQAHLFKGMNNFKKRMPLHLFVFLPKFKLKVNTMSKIALMWDQTMSDWNSYSELQII